MFMVSAISEPVSLILMRRAPAYTNCHSDIRFSLKQQLRSLKELPLDFGIPGYLSDTSNNIAHGALEVFPSLLLKSPPSADLCITLKQSFDEEVTLRTPSSSHKARNSIHRYLLVRIVFIYCASVWSRID